MLKYITIITILALSLSGCANVTAWLADPNTTTAINNLKTGSLAFICTVASTAAIAAQIENDINVHKTVITTTGTILTISQTLCAAYGGIVSGQTVVPGKSGISNKLPLY